MYKNRGVILSHYFTNDNVKSEIKVIKSIVKGNEYKFYTDYNVFSKDKIDFGTRLLLESIENIEGEVLDLGCGYGVIGIYLRNNFNVLVDMIDINNRAILLCKKNIELYKLENINVFQSDGYENIFKKYDYIITNPPIRIGKKKLYEILLNSINYLKDSGKLIIVIRKEQGAKSLIKELEKVYFVEIINKKKGYYILKSTKKQYKI